MQAFEAFLSNHLPKASSFHPHYEAALQAMLRAGGKRFRPALLLAVVRAYAPLLVESAYHAAYALELLHTYSLIHDDLPVMDDAALRRAQPTLHVRYDEVTAVLVGDALNTHAFEVLSKAPFADRVVVRLIRTLAENGGAAGMVLGQAIDCHFEGQLLTLEQMKYLHVNKTAKLIAASLKMGATIAGKRSLEEPLYTFGIDLGLLFQIQDDILDVTQSAAAAGKTTQNDADKNSFVTVLGLERALEEADALASELNERLASMDECLRLELSALLYHYINRHKEYI